VAVRHRQEPPTASPSAVSPTLEIAPVLPGLLSVAAVAIASPWLLMMQSTLTSLLVAVAVLQVVYQAVKSVVSGHELLQVVFWVFAACYLIVPAIYQLAYLKAAWEDYFIYLDDQRVQDALIVLDVAFAAFGFGSRSRPSVSKVEFGRASGALGVNTSRATWARQRLLLAYCGVAVLLLPVVLGVSGFASLFSSRAGRNNDLAANGVTIDQTGGAVAAFYQILPGAVALAAAYGLLMTRGQQRHGVPRAALVVSLAMVVIYLNPLANTRYLSSTAVIALLLVILQPRSRRGMASVALGLVLGLFAIYPIANVFRSADVEPEPLSLSSIDFDGFQQLVNTQQFVEQQGHADGQHLISATFFFVPRSFWTSKAMPASLEVAANRGYSFTNLSLPLTGELYLDLGGAGAAIVMYGWGRLWRRLDDDWFRGFGSPGARLVPYLAIAQVGLLRGPLGSVLPAAGLPVILLALALTLPMTSSGQPPGISRGLRRSAGTSTR